MTIAVGCTGGRHRSVALTNWLAAKLEAAGHRVAASHRDLAAHAPALADAALAADAPDNSSHGAVSGSNPGAQSQTFETQPATGSGVRGELQ